uniref:Interleukin-7 n=1 Tax=Astatotilapia calliptera TaxID=8154 RepID=A0A3P8QL11_ASTCA
MKTHSILPASNISPSFLVLLLLPLSLSCGSVQLDNIRSDYITIIQTELQRTTEEITSLLQNSDCSVFSHKLRNCTPGNATSVRTLHNLTCKMRSLPFLQMTLQLITSVEISMSCHCREKSIKMPTESLKRRRGATRRRRNEGTKNRKQTKKLCKAKAILSAMTECYQMLNSL